MWRWRGGELGDERCRTHCAESRVRKAHYRVQYDAFGSEGRMLVLCVAHRGCLARPGAQKRSPPPSKPSKRKRLLKCSSTQQRTLERSKGSRTMPLSHNTCLSPRTVTIRRSLTGGTLQLNEGGHTHTSTDSLHVGPPEERIHPAVRGRRVGVGQARHRCRLRLHLRGGSCPPTSHSDFLIRQARSAQRPSGGDGIRRQHAAAV